MTKILFIGLLILTTAVSCGRDSADSTYVSEYEPSDKPILFGKATIWDDYGETTTKSDETIDDYFTTGETFGMYAFYVPYVDGKATWISYTPPDFMNNQEFTYQSDETWSYYPTKYWPNNTNDEILFWGYASHGADDLEFTSIGYDASGNPVLIFTSPTNMAYSRDFVTGKLQTPRTDLVSLYLERKLCRVRFDICNGVSADKFTVRVDKITVTGVTTTSAFCLDDYGQIESYDNLHNTGQVVGDYTTIIPYDNDSGDQTFLKSEYGSKDDSNRFIKYGIEDGQYIYYSIVTDDRYWYVDPYVATDQTINITLEMGLYTSEDEYVERTLVSTIELSVDGTSAFKQMEVNNTYTLQILYTPIVVIDPETGEEVTDTASGLFVYCVEEWEDIVLNNDI